MRKFDFGVLVRRIDPKVDMGGLINLNVDLGSSAGSFDKLMANLLILEWVYRFME